MGGVYNPLGIEEDEPWLSDPATVRLGELGYIQNNNRFGEGSGAGACNILPVFRCLNEGLTIEEIIGRGVVLTKDTYVGGSSRPDYMPLACGNVVQGKISVDFENTNADGITDPMPGFARPSDAVDEDGDSCNF